MAAKLAYCPGSQKLTPPSSARAGAAAVVHRAASRIAALPCIYRRPSALGIAREVLGTRSDVRVRLDALSVRPLELEHRREEPRHRQLGIPEVEVLMRVVGQI